MQKLYSVHNRHAKVFAWELTGFELIWVGTERLVIDLRKINKVEIN